MKSRLKSIIFCIFAILTFGCSDFLDVIPDKTQEIDMLFDRRSSVQTALAACYHFLPQSDVVYQSFSFASEELIAPLEQRNIPGREIIRGKQNTSYPILGFWNDYSGPQTTQKSLWKGIRYCNMFINGVDQASDMERTEKDQWKSEAIFLKAYYHFLLFSQYGPIPIVNEEMPIDTDPNLVRVKRQSVDNVINYIVATIDKAMPKLALRIINPNDLGHVDQVIAKAIKSRVLLYAASPLFNGNATFYDRFYGKDGELLFNAKYDPEKWRLAAEATKEALEIASRYTQIYYHDSIVNPILPEDSAWYELNPVKAIYNYRYVITDKWNSELIWGNSRPHTSWWRLQAAAFPMFTDAGYAQGAAWSWAVPTIDIAEAYYTRNGLPIDEDLTWDYDRRFTSLARASDQDTLFVMQGQVIPRFHLNREPRFYASIAFDRSLYRISSKRKTMMMRFSEPSGKQPTGDYSATGYLLKKIIHMNADSRNYNDLILYPWPIIRLSELYLNYAEALNEYYGPEQAGSEIFNALNIIRDRVYLRHVEDVWNDPAICKHPGKHMTKDGLREIIHAERRIELAFEGNRNFDVRRWIEGDKYFTNEVLGWSITQAAANDYYKLTPIFQRAFITPRDYLFPIKFSEMDFNSNLVQNPKW